MNRVVTPAVRGDYVVTPSHLRMERRLEFYGQDPSYRPEASQTAMNPSEAPLIEDDY
jgi:hypothetical protein